MTETKKLLEERKRVKIRKPDFLRADGHKKAKLPKKWRSPKGLHNKMRRQLRGYRRIVKNGWGSPAEVRGTDSQGRLPVIVTNLAQVESLDVKKNSVIISSKVGLKTKLSLMAAAKAKKLVVLNVTDEGLGKRQKARDSARAEKEAARALKSKKVKESEKKSEDKKSEAPLDADAEDKKRQEKAERDKVLTKREP